MLFTMLRIKLLNTSVTCVNKIKFRIFFIIGKTLKEGNARAFKRFCVACNN